AAGVLASTSPPDRAVEEGTQGPPQYLEFANFTKTTHVILQIAPNPPRVGLQDLVVQLHPLTATPLPNSTQVFLKVAPPGEGEPELAEPMAKQGPDTWAGEDAYFTSPGAWKVYLLVQRPDEFAKLSFTVNVLNATAS